MKKIATLLFLGLGFCVYTQAQKPVYDESKFYQFRAIENGPWEFRPKYYYHSWITKRVLGIKIKVPGLGVHENGPGGIGIGGDNYIKRYSPNAPLRDATMLLSMKERENYEKQLEHYEQVQNIEAKLISDRQLDIVYPFISGKFHSSKERLFESLLEYSNNLNSKHEEKALFAAYLQYSRIEENIKNIKGYYVENGKRQELYLEEINKIDDLNATITTLLKFQYNTKINKSFINLNNK